MRDINDIDGDAVSILLSEQRGKYLGMPPEAVLIHSSTIIASAGSVKGFELLFAVANSASC
jgi:hypothetical protein